MEPPNTTIKYSIDKEIKFKKAHLVAKKDIVDSHCNSRIYNIYTIFNIRCYISIYPKEIRKTKNGLCMAVLHLHKGNTMSVQADIEFSVASAKIFKSMTAIYENSNDDGYGVAISTSKKFFDAKSNFFIGDDLILRIKGDLIITLSSRIKYPISAQWSIKDSALEALRNSTNNGALRSKRFNISSDSDVKYYLILYPNGKNDEQRGKVHLYFCIELGTTVSKIEAAFKFSIGTAFYSYQISYVFKKSEGYGTYFVCSTDDLFNPDKRFIVDGQLVLKVNGTLMIEKGNDETINLACEKGVASRAYLRHRGKGFTIVVGDKSIKVHKKVLTDASDVLNAMFQSGMKEVTEKKMTITDFDYDIVDTAIKLLYSGTVPPKFTFEQMLELLRFADKYQIELIKELVQDYLIEKLSPTNICYLINYTTSTVNATKLNTKCNEYLVKCLKESKPVSDLDTLDKDFMVKTFMGAFSHTLEIENA